MTTKRSCRFSLSLALLAGMAMTLPGYATTDDSLQRIRQEGVLHAATEPAFEPYEFMQGGKIVGYGTDILHEVAKRMGVRLDQQGMAFSAVIPSLLTHKVDLIATTMVATPERAKKMAFTKPIGEAQEVILTNVDTTNIHDMNDFEGKVMGAQQSAYMVTEYEQLNQNFKAKGGKGIARIAEYQAFPELAIALATKQIDATVLPLPMAAIYMKKHPGKLKIAGLWTPQKNKTNDSVWAVRLEDQALKGFIDDTLNAMTADGTLSQLQIKWFGNTLDAMKKAASSH